MATLKVLKQELYNLEQERDEYLPRCTWHPRYTELCDQIIAKEAEIRAKKRIDPPRKPWKACPDCRGDGLAFNTLTEECDLECSTCRGWGFIHALKGKFPKTIEGVGLMVDMGFGAGGRPR